MLLLRRGSRPHIAVVERVPENEQPSGVLVFRVDAATLYFNVEYVRGQFIEQLNHPTPPVQLASGVWPRRRRWI